MRNKPYTFASSDRLRCLFASWLLFCAGRILRIALALYRARLMTKRDLYRVLALSHRIEHVSLWFAFLPLRRHHD